MKQAIIDYLNRSDWKVRENSNMTYSLQGLNNHMVSKFTAEYWLDNVYSDEVSDAHRQGWMHIHDLGLLAPYCCGWDLEDLLLQGFCGVDTKIESNPPSHFRSALGQIINFIYTLQGEAAGAQALSSFDTYLAPFIYNDHLSYTEVKQCIQEFLFNVNVPTRVGFQCPFLNLTFDINPPPYIENEPVIIGGERKKHWTYGKFQKEMDMLNLAFCEVMLEGDKKDRIFSFPIPTYNITEDTDFDSDVGDAIMRMTAKYGTPYFSNFINSDMEPEDVRSMCCRLRLNNGELRRRGGGLFGANPLTGSIGVVTLNMPRIAYISKDKNIFNEHIWHYMNVARDSLVQKREALERFTSEGLYPYSKFYLRSVQKRFGEYWKNHFSTIGLVGMNEALLNLTGKGIGTVYGKELAMETLDHMNDQLRYYQKETGDMWNLEATPGEGSTYRLAKKDAEDYDDIIQAGTDRPFYTNSTQLPVNFTDDLFEELTLQDELQERYTGGTVLHGFLGEKVDDIETVRRLILRIANKFKLPYFSLTPTFSICPEHGYLSGEQWACPHCDSDCEVWSRVVGFYRPVQNWNDGKQEEFAERKEFEGVAQ